MFSLFHEWPLPWVKQGFPAKCDSMTIYWSTCLAMQGALIRVSSLAWRRNSFRQSLLRSPVADLSSMVSGLETHISPLSYNVRFQSQTSSASQVKRTRILCLSFWAAYHFGIPPTLVSFSSGHQAQLSCRACSKSLCPLLPVSPFLWYHCWEGLDPVLGQTDGYDQT